MPATFKLCGRPLRGRSGDQTSSFSRPRQTAARARQGSQEVGRELGGIAEHHPYSLPLRSVRVRAPLAHRADRNGKGRRDLGRAMPGPRTGGDPLPTGNGEADTVMRVFNTSWASAGVRRWQPDHEPDEQPPETLNLSPSAGIMLLLRLHDNLSTVHGCRARPDQRQSAGSADRHDRIRCVLRIATRKERR